MNHIRQEKIRQFIELHSTVSIRQLQELCPDVSLMTIHRDLDILSQLGEIVKVRGGARSVRHTGDPGFEERLRENLSGKRAIAEKALALIQPGTSVFLDASTTNLTLARLLPDIPLRIFTTGPNIAMELCRLHEPTITLCSGIMIRKNMALSGQTTLDMLEKINIDLALVGVSGCSAEAGFTCGTESDMLVKRLVIRKARTSVMLCDQQKFSRLMPYTFASFDEVDYLLSDSALPEAIQSAAQQSGVKIL
jgi:DeoR family transcriptional regulator of aga operon